MDKLKKIIRISLALAKADFKMKNEGSYLGIFWYLLEPLLLFLIIWGIRLPFFKNNLEYALYLLTGLVMFNFFSKTTDAAASLIKNNAALIKNWKIDYEALLIAKVMENAFAHFFSFLLIVAAAIILRHSLWFFLLYPFIFIFYAVFTAGASLILAALGSVIFDLVNIWKIVTRLLFFATPIFYKASMSPLLHKLNLFNPLYYFLKAGRSILVYSMFPSIRVLSIIFIFSLVSVLVGQIIFNKFKKQFAERV